MPGSTRLVAKLSKQHASEMLSGTRVASLRSIFSSSSLCMQMRYLAFAGTRLETIPGVGVITATAIAVTVTDPSHFRSGREFAAWLGLTPRQNSSGGKDRLGRISKMGNSYFRSLIVVGATAMIC
jgi:transposase